MATILVVDDRPENRQYLVTLLGYKGHQILEAADGAEALDLLNRKSSDLVITDVLMPTMDGYEFVRQLRGDERLATTPVVFYTAHYREREAHALAQACGVSHVLIKPSEPQTVLDVVQAVLAGRPAVDPPRVEETFDREHLRLVTDKLAEQSAELQVANLKLSALIDINLQLASERDPQRLIEGFCRAARDLVGARYASVAVFAEGSRTPKQFYISGMTAAMAALVGAPEGDKGVLAEVRQTRQPRRIVNPSSEPAALGLPSAHPPIHSFLAAAVVSLTRTYGWIYLIDKLGAPEFNEDEERLLAILAAQVGRIYENGRMYQEVQRHAAQLEQEIAERRQAEEAVRQLETRYRNLVEHIPAVTFISALDQPGSTVYVSPQITQMLGFTREEWLADPALWIGQIHHDDRDRVLQARRQTRTSGAGYSVEYRMLHKDGSLRWIHSEAALLTDEFGAPVFLQGVMLDLTERKRVEQQLTDSELRFQGLLEAARDIILVVDADGTIASLSPSFEIMTGWRRVEWIGQPFQPLLHVDDVVTAEALFDRAIRGEHLPVFELRVRKKSGEAVVVELTTTPHLGGGGVGGVLCIARDVTERKLLEEQFRQAAKMEGIGRLAGGVAHDFNNMLTVITGYCELLLADLGVQDANREVVEEIGRAAERAGGLTRQLLAFSRRQVLAPIVLDLNEAVVRMQGMLRRVIGADVELLSDLARDLSPVRADPSQIEQVVLNLAVNARDAMPDGGRLTIETANVDLDETYVLGHIAVRPGRYVMLAVSDNGHGMTEDVRAHLFEPFFTTKPPGQGTGLGLATVYGIVKQSEGHVWVYSEPGVGSTFKIYLPQAAAAVDTIAPVVPVGRTSGTETILLVEDEESVRTLATRILRSRGYGVIEARDGTEAIRLMERTRPTIDLVVTDIVMPGMGGRQLSEQLLSGNPGLKVLFLSGYTDATVGQQGGLEPGALFLQKPFTPDTLLRKVREVLDGGG